jgi:hypothetical protein
MTKDGRPSRICDIRYFHPERHSYLKGHEDGVAFGRRLAWFLNGEEFSVGAYTALYILLTPSIERGSVQITHSGGDWWQRYTIVGVPEEFPNVDDAENLIKHATIAALKTIRPDLTEVIENAARIAENNEGDLRFLLKTHKTKKFIIDISCNISVWPKESLLFLSITDLDSGAFLEAPPTPIKVYLDALGLAGAIKVTDSTISLLPNQSLAAQMAAARHGGSIEWAISEFLPREKPVLSRLIKPRG